jgi:S1-C subfamily serine protease
VWFKPAGSTAVDRDTFLVAKVIHKDVGRDLAHIRIVSKLPPKAAALPLGEAAPAVGQGVFVIGHPKGYLWSLTQGIVAQVRPNHRWSYADNIPRMATAIQTQAPVNPGNSGGPLLDEGGRMIGVVVGAPTGGEGMFFAVAVQHVRDLLGRSEGNRGDAPAMTVSGGRE